MFCRCHIKKDGVLLTLTPFFDFPQLIRHGEKPASGNGLNAQGEQRAQCLSKLFVPPAYNIGKIIAQSYKKDGSQERPYDTVLPLANTLGLPIDTSCSTNDASCVGSLVQSYQMMNTTKSILICWEHQRLSGIVDVLTHGVSNPGMKYIPLFDAVGHCLLLSTSYSSFPHSPLIYLHACEWINIFIKSWETNVEDFLTDYPDDRFDLIWEIENGSLVSTTGSEQCPGLDSTGAD